MIFWTLWSFVLLLMGWYAYCNHITHRDLLWAGQQVFAIDSADMRWMIWGHELLLAGYAAHFWRLTTFRNPWDLYSPELRAFLGKDTP